MFDRIVIERATYLYQAQANSLHRWDTIDSEREYEEGLSPIQSLTRPDIRASSR